MKAIRRFTVRNITLPEPLAALHGPDAEPSLVLAPPGRRPVRLRSIPPPGRASGGDPIAMLGAGCRRPGSPRSRPTGGLPPWRLGRGGRAGPAARYMSRAALVQAGQGGARRPRESRTSHPEYGITAALPRVLRRAGHPRRRPPEDSQTDLGVPLIGVGLLYRARLLAVAVGRRLAGRAVTRSDDPERPAPGAAPGRPPARQCTSRWALTAGRELAAQVWVAQVGRVPLLLLDSYLEENEPDLHEVTDRLYGGGQRPPAAPGGAGSASAGCARCGPSAPCAGTPRPRSSTPTRVTPASSAWSASGRWTPSRASASTRPSKSLPCGHGVHHAHPGPRGHRPVRAQPDLRAFLREKTTRCCPPGAGARARRGGTYPGGGREVFNMAVMGMRLAQRVNGVSLLHGQVSREMLRSPACGRGFDTREVPIARSPTACAPPPGSAPAEYGSRRRARLGGERAATAPPAELSGDPGACCAAGWWPRPGAGCAPPGGSAAPPMPVSRLDEGERPRRGRGTVGFAAERAAAERERLAC